jgi:UrcA family protein
MNTKLNTAFRAVALVGTLGLFSSGYAQSSSAAPSTVVRFADLDLSSPAGVRALYGRIQNAAWHVCLQNESTASGIENVRCRQSAVDAAVGKVNRPALTALNAGKKPSDMTARR